MTKHLGLVLASFVLSVFFATKLGANLSGSLDEKAILERIKPIGAVSVDQTTAPAASSATQTAANIGQQHYEQVCHICHEAGLAGAPKFGDKADWAPRIAQGMDTMVQRAIQGYKAMPPKGTCSSCSDEDIRKTVEYMVSHSE